MKTKILYGLTTLMFWILCYTCTAQISSIEKFDNGVFTEDTTLNKFIVHWLGKPYKLGGRTEKGIDCSQFNKRLYLDVYKINLENVCYKQWIQTLRVRKDSLQVGDLLFFRSRQSPSGWHCGTYIGDSYFVHAANRYEGVKVSSLTEPKYRNTYKGAGRIN
jgi:cell wall-associated NlpC family hydrolase